MSRYTTTQQIKDASGKRKAETTILPVVPISEDDIYIQVTSPERLDLLADKFYNDVSLWWVIATANALGKGSLYVPENTRLRIPAATKIQDVIESLNNSR